MEASINGCTAVVDLLIRFGAKPEGTSYDVGQETLPACSSFVKKVLMGTRLRFPLYPSLMHFLLELSFVFVFVLFCFVHTSA